MENLIEKWGPAPVEQTPQDGSLLTTLIDFLLLEHPTAEGHDARALLNRMDPVVGDKRTISYYPCAKKRDRDIRQEAKPGKFLRKIYPDAKDQIIEKWVRKLRERHLSFIEDMTHEVTRNFIGEVYQMDSGPCYDPIEGEEDFKCLNNSCMRYDFGEYHPCEAYENPDWELHYLHIDEKIFARCLVNVPSATRGPIYGVNYRVMDRLESLVALPLAIDGDWIGSRLNVIDDNGHSVVGPYLDFVPRSMSYEKGNDFMTIGEDGNVCGQEHEGRLPYRISKYCTECGASIDHNGDFCSDCGIMCHTSFTYYPEKEMFWDAYGNWHHNRYRGEFCEFNGKLYPKREERQYA